MGTNSRKIEYFFTLAECLNFTQAAAVHSVSQTAISQYIATLEERLGVRLFRRNSHNVTLTDAGRFYYERMKFIEQYRDDTERRIRAIDEEFSGYLKIGIGLYEYSNTEHFFSAFLQSHPSVKVDIFQYEYSTLTEKLRTGELDVIIALYTCEEAFEKEAVQSRTLFESGNYMIMDRSVSEKHRDESLGDILKEEYLITNCEDNGPSSLAFLRKTLKKEFGFVPQRILQTNSVGAQLLMVRAGHGVALAPGFLKDLQDPDIVSYPLAGEIMRYNLVKLTANRNPVAALLMDFDPDAVR
ncbi:MAG: LysR family transcriptional regulator [Clostridia bacterium]|nr:LysR family transcriptional regulator [Clostridia bacterium]